MSSDLPSPIIVPSTISATREIVDEGNQGASRPKRRGRKAGSANYSRNELNTLKLLVQEFQPRKDEDWQDLCELHNRSTGQCRTSTGLRTKYYMSKSNESRFDQLRAFLHQESCMSPNVGNLTSLVKMEDDEEEGDEEEEREENDIIDTADAKELGEADNHNNGDDEEESGEGEDEQGDHEEQSLLESVDEHVPNLHQRQSLLSHHNIQRNLSQQLRHIKNNINTNNNTTSQQISNSKKRPFPHENQTASDSFIVLQKHLKIYHQLKQQYQHDKQSLTHLKKKMKLHRKQLRKSFKRFLK
jgi:hypothetical protein